MELGKRMAAVVIAAATALTALSASAFAADVIGTNPTKLKDAEQATFQIPYSGKKFDYDDGHNYKDLIFTVPTDGKVKITFDASINFFDVKCYRDSDKCLFESDSTKYLTGSYEMQPIPTNGTVPQAFFQHTVFIH